MGCGRDDDLERRELCSCERCRQVFEQDQALAYQ